MLFRRAVLEGIACGDVDLAFRRWQRPRVKAGSRLRTAVGVVEVGAVEPSAVDTLTELQARRAGFCSLADLVAMLDRGDGEVYRITVRLAGPDPRLALRERAGLGDGELASVAASLARLDAASRHGQWTGAVLRLLAENPAVRAADLAPRVGRELRLFKADVRRLKELGLTESLEVGYRLSPRGEEVLRRLPPPPTPPVL